MPTFDDGALVEFLRRSYFVVDGLWFVRTEAEHGYDEALRLDEQVWDIVPKIQARKARELLGVRGSSLPEMVLCLQLKLDAEGHEYRVLESSPRRAVVEITECPWLSALTRSGREELANDICDRICTREATVWASEFSREIAFRFDCRMSCGGDCCRLVFTGAGDGHEG